VKVIHQAQEISRRRPFSKSARMHVLGLIYYFRKYGYCLRLDGLYARIQAAVAAREKLLVPDLEKVLSADPVVVSEPAPAPTLAPAATANIPAKDAAP
jgi:hypothetical protein